MAQAWQVSLDHADQDCPAAAELLRLLAFLGPDAVPRELLGAKPEALPEALRDPFDRDGAIEALARYSLLRAAPDSLTVHRLVQAVTRDGLDQAASARCVERAIALVDAALPPPTWDNVHRSAIEKLLPQALAAVEEAERFGVVSDSLGAILTVVGEYHYAGGAYDEAEPLLRRAVAVREQVLGPDHPNLATPLHKLANVCDDMGRSAEAESLYRRVVAVRERAFDPGHPLIAEAMGCLGIHLFCHVGRRAEAEPIIARSLASYERTIGPDHPDLALSLFHMAWLYRESGRPVDAEPRLLARNRRRRTGLGPRAPAASPDFLIALAGLYWWSGR